MRFVTPCSERSPFRTKPYVLPPVCFRSEIESDLKVIFSYFDDSRTSLCIDAKIFLRSSSLGSLSSTASDLASISSTSDPEPAPAFGKVTLPLKDLTPISLSCASALKSPSLLTRTRKLLSEELIVYVFD